MYCLTAMAKNKFRSIKKEFAFLGAIILFILVASITIYIYYSFRKDYKTTIQNRILVDAQNLSAKINDKLQLPLMSARSLAQTFTAKVKEKSAADLTREEANSILKEVLTSNPSYHGVYTLWEPFSFDNKDNQYVNAPGHDETGRFLPYWEKDSSGTLSKRPLLYYNTQGIGNYYLVPKRRMRESIINPFIFPYSEKNVPLISLVVPVIHKNRFYGITGVDISTNIIQKIVTNNTIYSDEADISVLSNNGTYAASSKSDTLVGMRLESIYSDYARQVSTIKNATLQYNTRENDLVVKVPFEVGETQMPWQLRVSVPSSEIYQQARQNLAGLILIALGVFLVGLFVFIRYVNSIVKFISSLTKSGEEIANGNIEHVVNVNNNNELGQLGHSLNNITNYFREISNVSEAIAKGDFSQKVKTRSEKDYLGTAINKMDDELQKIDQENRKQRQEAELRNWSRQGLAELGSILNKRSESLEELTYKILEHLINYLNIEVGGIYIYYETQNEDTEQTEKYLKLITSFAYDRRKYFDTKIDLGEGLVGTCAQEGETIYMTELPENYLNITGGMGVTKPRSLILLPLKEQENLHGILELATVRELRDYEIDFIKEAGINIATTLAATKINERTNQLLEQSRKQAKDLASQEEEMRQNLEELQATQEESKRRETEMQGILNALNNAFYVLEIDMEGKVLNANEKYLQRMGYTKDQINEKLFQEFSPLAKDNQYYEQFMNDLKNGMSREEEVTQKLPNEEVATFQEYFTPILDNNNNPYKVLNISFDITKQKELQHEIQENQAKAESMLSALNETLGTVEFYFDGTYWRIKNANDIFLNSLNLTLDEIKDQFHSYLIDEEMAKSQQYKGLWRDVVAGDQRSWEKKYTLSDNTEVWKQETFNPIINAEGEIVSIIMFSYNITETKKNQQ